MENKRVKRFTFGFSYVFGSQTVEIFDIPDISKFTEKQLTLLNNDLYDFMPETMIKQETKYLSASVISLSFSDIKAHVYLTSTFCLVKNLENDVYIIKKSTFEEIKKMYSCRELTVDKVSGESCQELLRSRAVITDYIIRNNIQLIPVDDSMKKDSKQKKYFFKEISFELVHSSRSIMFSTYVYSRVCDFTTSIYIATYSSADKRWDVSLYNLYSEVSFSDDDIIAK